MNNEHPLRIGILGAARIAEQAIVRPAATHGGAIVQCVAARDPARARNFADVHGVPKVADNYAALLARDDIDLVYIALPPAAHRQWAEQAAAAGKAVLCEKPFALDVADAVAMVAAAEAAGQPLIEGFHYRFHAMFRSVERLIADGAIGRPTGANAWLQYPIPDGADEHRWSPALGGGALMDLGCYPLHALRTLFRAEPEVIAADRTIERDVDACMSARLRFPGGAGGAIRASMRTDAPSSGIVVTGERGRIEVRNFILPQRGAEARLIADGRETSIAIEGASTYAAQLDHVIDVMRGRAPPLTGGADAIANMRAIDAIRAAYAA